LVGNCFASEDGVQTAAVKALATKDPTTLLHLPGSFVTLILQRDRFAAFSDLVGQFPCYYRQVADSITIGSRASIMGEALDTTTLAARVACAGIDELTTGRSVFSGVNRLEAGQSLVRDSQLRISTYETLAPQPARTFDETAEALSGALNNAVAARATRARVTSDFSGGLDSSSIAHMAAQHRVVPGFTHYNPDVPTGDITQARRLAALNSNIILHELPDKPETLPYQHLADAPQLTEPKPSIIAWKGDQQFFTAVRQIGADIHLTGEGGDAVLGAPAGYLADLVQVRRLTQLRRDAFDLARLRHHSPLAVLMQAVRFSRTDISEAFQTLAQDLEQPIYRSFEWADTLAWWPRSELMATWLTPQARNNLRDLALSRAAEASVPEGLGIGDYLALRSVRSAGTIHAQFRESGQRYGVNPQAPFLDNEVVRACMALPSYRRADPRSFKALLRQSLADIVPKEVLARQTKGSYWGTVYAGMHRALPEITALLNESRLADLGIIEPAAVLALLQKMDALEYLPFTHFNQVIAVELWLRSLDTAQRASVRVAQPQSAPITLTSATETTPPTPEERYAIPEYIQTAVNPKGKVALLNTQTKGYFLVNDSGKIFLQALAETGMYDDGITALRRAYPQVPPPELRADALHMFKELLAKGFMVASDTLPAATLPDAPPAVPANMTHGQVAMARELEGTPRIHEAALAVGALITAVRLHRLPLNRTQNLIQKIQGAWCTRYATPKEAHEMLTNVHRVAQRGYLGRAACLQASLATTVYAALRRRRIDWCIGIALQPLRRHAWIEIDNKPIVTSYDEDITGVYHKFAPLQRVQS
jgi:asparagine synthase (glutamine-hydrolysing)